MTLGDMKEALKRYGFSDDDPLTIWLNAAMHQFADAYPWPFLETFSTYFTTIGSDTIDFGSNFFSVSQIRHIVGLPLDYMGTLQFEDDIQDPSVSGKPTIYTLSGMSGIRLYPVPDAAYELRVTFRRLVFELENDTDTPFEGLGVFDPATAYHYTIVQGAAAIALMAENEEDRATTAQDQFNAGISRAIQAYSTRAGGFGQVRDTQGYGQC